MDARSSFPAETGRESRSNFKQCTSCRGLLMSEKDNRGGDIFRLKFCNLLSTKVLEMETNHFLRHDSSGHSGTSGRCNDIDQDIILLSFPCESFRKPNNREFCSRIIRLSEIAVNPTR